MYALCVGFRKCDALILCEQLSFDKIMQRSVGKSTRGRAACSAELLIKYQGFLDANAVREDTACLFAMDSDQTYWHIL